MASASRARRLGILATVALAAQLFSVGARADDAPAVDKPTTDDDASRHVID